MATDDQGPFDSFDEVCTQAQGPPTTRTGNEPMSHQDLRDLCRQTGYARRDSKVSLCARLKKMDEVYSGRGPSIKAGRTQQDVAEACDPVASGQLLDKRCRRADAHLNFVT